MVSNVQRFDAHRPQCKHTIILVWALGEHKRPNGLPSLLLCALREHRRPTGPPSSYIFGIRSVLLIIKLPDKTNSNAKGWSSHGPIVHVPQ